MACKKRTNVCSSALVHGPPPPHRITSCKFKMLYTTQSYSLTYFLVLGDPIEFRPFGYRPTRFEIGFISFFGKDQGAKVWPLKRELPWLIFLVAPFPVPAIKIQFRLRFLLRHLWLFNNGHNSIRNTELILTVETITTALFCRYCRVACGDPSSLFRRSGDLTDR